MVPGVYNITIYRGGTFEIDFYAEDDDGPISLGEIYDQADLIIYDAWVTPTEVNLPTPLMELSTTSGEIIISGTQLRIHLPAAITEAISFVGGTYRLKLTITDELNPVVDPFMQGTVTIRN
jgi:hypothetical protein